MNESAGATQRMAYRNRRTAWMGGGAVLAMAGLGLWLGAATVASGAGAADVVIDPASKNVALNSGDFTVDVKVENASNLGAYEVLIKFNTDVLEYVGMAKTNYLTTTGRSQTCTSLPGGPNGEAATEYANDIGMLIFGCATNGLIQDGNGTFGPSGTGTLATISFKPKGAGQSDIELAGVQQRVIVAPPQGEFSGIAGMTQLSEVEQCTGNACAPYGIATGARSAIVQVFDPSAPTPTGVPATPTRVVPANTPVAGATATKTTVLSGTPAAQGTRPAGVAGGSGSGGTTGGGITGAGTTSGGTRPGGSVAGAGNNPATGPNGAPIAGYGPQQEPNPWPLRAGMLMTLAGGLIMAGGALTRRTAR